MYRYDYNAIPIAKRMFACKNRLRERACQKSANFIICSFILENVDVGKVKPLNYREHSGSPIGRRRGDSSPPGLDSSGAAAPPDAAGAFCFSFFSFFLFLGEHIPKRFIFLDLLSTLLDTQIS